MKKIVIFFIIVIAIVSTVTYIYLNQVANYRTTQKENAKIAVNKEKEMTGSELATIMNKVLDTNAKNKIQKDEEGKYIDNGENSINIDIIFIDNDVIYNIEKIYQGGISKFVHYYGNIKFKCIDVQYHEATGKIKYMKFEQITQ